MVEGRGEPSLAIETRRRRWTVPKIGGEELDRDQSPQPGVAGAIHFAHPALAKRFEQFVDTDLPGGRVCHRWLVQDTPQARPKAEGTWAPRPAAKAPDALSGAAGMPGSGRW